MIVFSIFLIFLFSIGNSKYGFDSDDVGQDFFSRSVRPTLRVTGGGGWQGEWVPRDSPQRGGRYHRTLRVRGLLFDFFSRSPRTPAPATHDPPIVWVSTGHRGVLKRDLCGTSGIRAGFPGGRGPFPGAVWIHQHRPGGAIRKRFVC